MSGIRNHQFISGIIFCLICFGSHFCSAETTKSSHDYLTTGINSAVFTYGVPNELFTSIPVAREMPVAKFQLTNRNEKKQKLRFIRLDNLELKRQSMRFGTSIENATTLNSIKKGFFYKSADRCRYNFSNANNQNFHLFAEATWLTIVNILTKANGLPERMQSGVTAGAFVEKSVKKHHVKAAVAVPVISWTLYNSYTSAVSRSKANYNKLDFIIDNSQLDFMNSLSALNTSIEYEYYLSKKCSIEGEYNFTYQHQTGSRPTKAVSSAYFINLSYSF